MRSTEELLLERRTVRRYTRDRIEPEKLKAIYEAIRNTPTSYNGQQFSVIEVNDQNTKEDIYAMTGQKQIKTCPTFLLFCLDLHKLQVAAGTKGIDSPAFGETMNGYTVGVIDASLAMMSAVVTAESLGLGSCCVGYARTADPRKLSQMLGLPKRVAIVCGLTLGYPAETPDLKPKLPLELVIHRERYTPDGEMAPALKEYDQQVQRYNTSRSGGTTDNDWTVHILEYHRHSMQEDIREYLFEQTGLK